MKSGVSRPLVLSNCALFSSDVPLPVIHHGEKLLDRKSVFMGHLAAVTHKKQVGQDCVARCGHIGFIIISSGLEFHHRHMDHCVIPLGKEFANLHAIGLDLFILIIITIFTG